ncbi:MAG: hypothetical protein HQ552_11330 [Desulfobacteraceae bacterium]|nr:hypothetical protein [Desulfobacteraceae bacterium]
MKRYVRLIITAVLILVVAGFGYKLFVGTDQASACGVGAQGGENYVPQWRDSGDPVARRPFLTKEQVVEVVVKHVKKLNPNLEVGRINDAGSFFEAEILSKDKEVVQLVGVDKESGKLMLIN